MSSPTRRLTSGPMRDGLAINVRELADATNMSVNAMRKSILDLESKGFIRNLTPELPIEKAVVRLTMFQFQGHPATEEYREDARQDHRRRLLGGSAIR
jgi:hypothetical protein